MDPPTGLSILIVGAGIAGLAAATALRQQGHQVEVFERSRLAEEVGAAIHLTPNANGALKRIGVDTRKYGAVKTEKYREYDINGRANHSMDVAEISQKWQHEWLLIHRAHLHDALKDKAIGAGKGKPAVLHTSCKIAEVDVHNASITLEDGKSFHGDLVLGADGVHAFTRRYVADESVKPFSSGSNAFRFLIPRQVVLDDPEVADLVEVDGTCQTWRHFDKRIVVYPCVNNTMLNLVCIHPDNLTSVGINQGWDQGVSKETLKETFKEFDPRALRILDKADPESIRIFPLLDMENLPEWTNDRLALVGDAAHPFLPYRASGGAMAIEDGLCLSILLPGDIKKDDVPARLKLYEEARQERVFNILQYTRDSATRPVGAEESARVFAYIFDHDEWDYSTEFLRRHLRAQNPQLYYRQPTVFGPMPGPRQDFRGRDRVAASVKSTFRTASIQFKTSRTYLKNLLPNTSYSFPGSGSVAHATLSQTTLDGMDWLAGGGYNHLGLYIHGVQHKGAGGQITEGLYLPVLFEDLTDAIISGREELGFPKVYSDIDIDNRRDSYAVTAGWRGAVWGRMSLTGLKEGQTSGSPQPSKMFVHRYMPSVGMEHRGTPEAEYPVVIDFAEESKTVPTKITRVLTAEKATFEIDGLDWKRLPTLHHIISRLAEVPVYEVLEGKVVEGEGVANVSSARRLHL
ncbi:hypothetical protein BDV25DRAFT_172095 [Aspergillus avenaceus]|uniref:FAD-binding domain-containing protein n=1 Tax=Aspergillus avenaceus TaxID=36643 RepID=A0A5N6U728_ASPAV|nr:hypothetical protein BDV25DRAFT_172095 [Aspergillus avenaceus]